jgi:hypothetical protein
MLSIIFNYLKKIILLLLVISATGTSAQQFNFKRYSLGIAAGVTHAYTDAPEMKIAPSLAFLFDYHITPFAAAYLDVQLGNIKGGSTEIDFVNVPNKHGREYSNTYTTATLNARLSLGQIIYYDETGFTNAIKG